jgi:hypothetical protein
LEGRSESRTGYAASQTRCEAGLHAPAKPRGPRPLQPPTTVDDSYEVEVERGGSCRDIVIRRNSARAARAGVAEADMEDQLHAALYGQVAATLPEEDRITNIRVRYPDRIRYDPAQLSRLLIPVGYLAVQRRRGAAA